MSELREKAIEEVADIANCDEHVASSAALGSSQWAFPMSMAIEIMERALLAEQQRDLFARALVGCGNAGMFGGTGHPAICSCSDCWLAGVANEARKLVAPGRKGSAK